MLVFHYLSRPDMIGRALFCPVLTLICLCLTCSLVLNLSLIMMSRLTATRSYEAQTRLFSRDERSRWVSSPLQRPDPHVPLLA